DPPLLRLSPLSLHDALPICFVSSVMLEAKEIGARIGIPIDQQAEDRHAVTLKLGAFKTSMLQDVEAGKAVELDALVTAVKELGEDRKSTRLNSSHDQISDSV